MWQEDPQAIQGLQVQEGCTEKHQNTKKKGYYTNKIPTEKLQTKHESSPQ